VVFADGFRRSLAGFLLMAAEDRHHPILRGQLELLNPFFLYFFFRGEPMLVSETLELALELLMLIVERLEFPVMV
jgi:hypothetical protein